MEKERDELREALDILEAHLGTGTRQCDSEDGTCASRVKHYRRQGCFALSQRRERETRNPKWWTLMERRVHVSERVARLITHQAGARGCSSPDSRKTIRQSPRLSAKSDKSAGSDMRSGGLPKNKLKTLSFADTIVSPTPEEQNARERVEARKRRHKKDPEEGKDGKKKEPFIIRPTFDALGRELISLVADTLRENGKQDVEAPTKADETMLLPLAQKMSKILDRRTSNVRQFEQSSLRDWVTPMALTCRGIN